MTRDARLVLAEQAANFRECLLFAVVETKPFPLRRFKLCEGLVQRPAKQGEVAFTMGIVRMELRSRRRELARILCVVFTQLFEATARADRINVSLSKNGAEPGFQRAAPVKVAEQRTSVALVLGETIQIREKRIREFARLRRTRTAPQNGRRRGA